MRLHVLLTALLMTYARALRAEWIPLNVPRISPKRSGHTAFGSYVFGGYTEDNEKKRAVINDLWQWKGEEWQTVTTTGDIPGPRLVSAAAILGKTAYLLGGWDPQTEGTGGVTLDTVHALDLDTYEWRQLDVKLPDGPSSRHVAVAFNDKIVMHNHRCDGFVWLFDPDTQTFEKQVTTGYNPNKRGLHAATRCGNKLVVFGGAAQDQTMTDECFTLDTETWQWQLLSCIGPSPRAAPCLAAISDVRAVLFGGAETSENGLRPRADTWMLHVEEERWELLLEDGPPPRNAATLTVDDTGNGLILAGGWNPFIETYDDCYRLEL